MNQTNPAYLANHNKRKMLQLANQNATVSSEGEDVVQLMPKAGKRKQLESKTGLMATGPTKRGKTSSS